MNASTKITETLRDLVSINSVNNEWGGPGEAAVADYVETFFRRFGVEVWTSEVLPSRSNVYARLKGRDRDRRILLEAHMDTVSVDTMTIPPFDATRIDNRLFGRGACDVKGGLAAMMHAVLDVHQSGQEPECDVWLAAVVDEEHRFRGVHGLLDELVNDQEAKTEAAIVAEPTECRIVIANKGVLRWRIETRGVAAHSSKPHLGHNAITDMARVIDALRADASRLEASSHALVGSPTLCVSLIDGGTQINFVPDRCGISIDRRLIPGEVAEDVLNDYRRIVDEIPDLDAEFHTPIVLDDAAETPPTANVVKVARRASAACGLNTSPCGVPFGCDYTKLVRAGIPSIIFGPGCIDQAHADVEFIDLDELESARRFYRTFISEYSS